MSQTVVFFRGVNTNNQLGLWETNGTASGTFEVTSIVNPSNLVAFGDEALFEGENTSGVFGLWATNGTPSGTVQLTPITGAAPNFNPSDLTVFNSEVLLSGNGTDGLDSLWETSGTAATTSEITGIAGPAAAAGLDPSSLAVVNGKVLFNGNDSRSNTAGRAVSGLWETDGTGAGTIELVGAGGPGGGSAQGGLNPEDITAFGADALFSATNAGGLVGLWEWNGSTAVELSVSGANAAELLPGNLTDLNGLALFSGLDTHGNTGLFKFDGTTGSELTGITDIHGVAVSDLDPRFLTVFGSEVLFNGTDSTGAQGLWETTGTVAGTHEILAGVGNTGGLDPSNFEVFGGQVLFSGKDASGNSQLWETDGNVGGTTQQVAGINNVSASGLVPFDLTTATVEIAAQNTNFSVLDTTTNTPFQTNGTPYSGPVAGLQWEFIDPTTDNLNVTANVPDVFIHTGSGEDAINVSQANGNNVLDGSTGSNFLVGGSGDDTFFVDDRGPSADIWSTVSNFHAGDSATIFGITQSGFDTSWVNGQGATGFTGLTLHVTAAGHPTASLTLAGFSTADMSDGRISTSFGHEADGTPYLFVHANS